MNVYNDPETYARLQHQLLINIARAIQLSVQSCGVKAPDLREFIESATSGVAHAIDEIDVFDGNPLPIRPHVCFGGMGLEDDALLSGGAAITMQSAVPYAVDDLFSGSTQLRIIADLWDVLRCFLR